MKLKLKEYYWKIPDQELIDNLLAVSKKLGTKTITMVEYNEHGKFHPRTLQSRFNSWYNAMKRAGLEPCRLPVALDERLLFENLRQVWYKLGKQPAFKDMKAPLSGYVGTTYVNHFGTWMNALRMFVEYQKYRTANSIVVIKPKIVLPEVKKTKKKKTKRRLRRVTHYMRYSVFIRDGFRCLACGKSPITEPGVKLHCDHIRPWSIGGEDEMDNLRTLCSECNIGKGNRMETGMEKPVLRTRRLK